MAAAMKKQDEVKGGGEEAKKAIEPVVPMLHPSLEVYRSHSNGTRPIGLSYGDGPGELRYYSLELWVGQHDRQLLADSLDNLLAKKYKFSKTYLNLVMRTFEVLHLECTPPEEHKETWHPFIFIITIEQSGWRGRAGDDRDKEIRHLNFMVPRHY